MKHSTMKRMHKLPPLLIVAVAAHLSCAALAQAQVEVPHTAPGQAGFSSQNRYVNPVAPGVSEQQPSRIFLDGAYAANAQVGVIEVEVSGMGGVADGRTPVIITVKLLDRKGKPLKGEALVTIENSGGRVLIPGAETAQFGPANKDADRNVPGTQLKIVDGAGSFSLIAPDVPGDVELRLSAGGVVAQGTLGFDPDVREMIAAGMIEGAIRLSRQDAALFQQVRLEDGFEQEIRRFSRDFKQGRGHYGARGALFLKGQIQGKNLLTLGYDSEKETRARLLKDIKPEEFYPVYGDASVKGFEAKSSDRLYVRIDNERSYLMYGDYVTGAGFTQKAGLGQVTSGNLRQLGAYNRTLTGARGHLEGSRGFISGFASKDSLKQVTEEYAANGTSGPIAVKNASALENSEKVEIVVRDKNARDRVISTTVLERLGDYTFEPFNGRILLARPLASLDPNGNPVSVRITYEVDQGGESFWLGGLDGQVNLGQRFTVGGSYVKDQNGLSPFQLGSVNVGVRLGKNTTLIAEAAQTESTTYSLGGSGASVFPTRAAGERTIEGKGKAGRIEFNHDGADTQAKAWYLGSGAAFNNPNSGLLGNREDFGTRAKTKLTERWSVNGQLQRTQDRGVDAHRDNTALGLEWRVFDRFTLLGGVRKVQEQGKLGATAALAQNPAPGSYFNPTGGFNGSTGPGSVIDPATGLPSLASGSNASTTFTQAQGPSGTGSQKADINVDATTVFLGAQWQLTDKLTVSGLGEIAVQSQIEGGGERPNRFEVGAAYQLAERTRAYLRGESQTGLAAATSLDGADRSRALLFGIDSTYREGQTVFSEFRLRDASTGRDAQQATGLRNTWQLREGLGLTTSAEYLKIFNGTGTSQGSDAVALGLGMDYTGAPLWKGSWKLDYRRVNDNPGTTPNERNDSVLGTVMVARKLDRDWTLLARNYALVQKGYAQLGAPGTAALPGTSINARSWQDRFQVGMAYRPVDSTRFDGLLKLEYKVENNISHQDEFRKVLIGSTHGVWHPSRPWWFNMRVAAKYVDEKFFNSEGGVQDTYKAVLLGSRLVYDITEKWDVGLMGSVLKGKAATQAGSSTQYAAGLEVGYAVAANLWASVGFNATGFNDRDLSGGEYTNKGAYLRLRYKFDEDLFRGNNKTVNRSLPRDEVKPSAVMQQRTVNKEESK
jgi:hypothetical protein